MSAKERRIAPRKVCAIPLRFRILTHFVGVGIGDSAGSLSPSQKARLTESGRVGIQEGEAVNLSERGIRFNSNMKLHVGEPIEMFFTLPTELSGRSPEAIRCNARVVHVNPGMKNGGMEVGAAIDRFEPLSNHRRGWDN
jgi:hypothetical protein